MILTTDAGFVQIARGDWLKMVEFCQNRVALA